MATTDGFPTSCCSCVVHFSTCLERLPSCMRSVCRMWEPRLLDHGSPRNQQGEADRPRVHPPHYHMPSPILYFSRVLGSRQSPPGPASLERPCEVRSARNTRGMLRRRTHLIPTRLCQELTVTCWKGTLDGLRVRIKRVQSVYRGASTEDSPGMPPSSVACGARGPFARRP